MLSHIKSRQRIGCQTEEKNHILSSNNPCSNKIGIKVQEMQDKTRHIFRKGPTAPVRREYPSRAKTMTDMETHIEI